jgi:hypothetical protein
MLSLYRRTLRCSQLGAQPNSTHALRLPKGTIFDRICWISAVPIAADRDYQPFLGGAARRAKDRLQ